MANSWQMELSDNSWQMELSDNSWQMELSDKIFLLYLTEIGFELIHKLKGVLPWIFFLLINVVRPPDNDDMRQTAQIYW